jgi:hypothetical protein
MNTSKSSDRVGFWRRIRLLLKSTLGIAAALILVSTAFGAFVLGWQFVDTTIKKAEAAPFEKVRDWQEVDGPAGLKMNARSKLIDGRLYVFAHFKGSPAYLDHAENNEGSFTINFADADGFSVYRKQLPLNTRSTEVDTAGKPIGFWYEFDEDFDLKVYARISEVYLSWNLLTSAPEPLKLPDPPDLGQLPAPKAAAASKLDHCAPGLRREERLERLAAYGSVRQTRDNAFEVGGRYLAFFDDGTLLSCR